MKANKPVPLIEVIDSKDFYDNSPGKVKFKGKLLDAKTLESCDFEYVNIRMPAEILFDFKAEELEEFLTLRVVLENAECLGLLTTVALYREESYVRMEFDFEIDMENPPKGDLNPFVTLPALTKAVENEKYKVKTYDEPLGIGISFQVPLSDNVYPHYQKHLAAFEKLCVPIEREIMERLLK